MTNSKQVWNLIHNLNCYILLAGNAKKMPEDVLAYLEKIVKENLLTDDDLVAKNNEIINKNKDFYDKLARNVSDHIKAIQ